MGRPELPAIAFLVTIAASLLSLSLSLGYLGGIAREFASAEREEGARRELAFISSPEPIPPGSITAIAPLPGRTMLPAGATARAAVAADSPAAAAPAPAAAEIIEAAAEQAVAAPQPSVDAGPQATGRQVMVVSSVNVRDRPSNNSRVIGTVRGGTRLAVTGEQQGWIQVSGEGRNGWIYRRFLRPVN